MCVVCVFILLLFVDRIAWKLRVSEKRFVHKKKKKQNNNSNKESSIANWLTAIGSQLFNELTHKAKMLAKKC